MQRKQHIEGYNYLFIMIVFLAMLGALVGCVTESKVDGYIDTHKPYRDSLTTKILAQYPCNNKVIAHHTDTFYTEEEIPYYFIDSVPCNGKAIHDTIKGKIKYIDTGYHSIDTIIDNQQLSLCKSQIEDKDKQIAILNQAVTDSRLQSAVNEKDASKWELYFWLLIAAIVIALVLYIVKPRL
jgi:hypothetical protein